MAEFSRTPSPGASGSDSDSVVATPLTPRAKLRALYATLGDDSDSNSEKENIAAAKASISRKSSRAGTPVDGAAVLGATSPPRNIRLESDDDDDDNDDIVLTGPHGRFAARMLGESSKQEQQQQHAAPPAGETARDRVRRMLQQAQQAEKKGLPSVEHDHENDAEDEDDDDVPVAARSRKLASRAARRSASPPQRQASREASPAMFMTPTKRVDREDSPAMFITPTKGNDNADDVELPSRAARFQVLVAKKREENRAREAEEERKRAARAARMAAEADEDMLMQDDDDDAITDDDGGRKLTQEVRPARKASKKALEEMHRETQRMSRNLQLAHEAKTRKKITKESLFERFNFKPAGAVKAEAAKPPESSSRPTSPVTPAHDAVVDDAETTDTPPSSPPEALARKSDAKESAAAAAAAAPEAQPQDKGKGKEVVVEDVPKAKPSRRVRVRLPVQSNVALVDDELEIVQTTKNKLDILFYNAPLKREKEARSILTLRRLAQIGSPDRKRKPKENNELTLGELQLQLQEKARRQAKLEREQQMEMLRAKGIHIQTEEEREREMAEVENIVARARQEADEIMQREKEEAKKEKKRLEKEGIVDDNDADPLAWDDSDEEGGDYDPAEEKEIELSGSEDEEEVDDDIMDETVEGAIIEDAAESAEESEDGEPEEEKEQEARQVLPTPTKPRPARRRAALVISDDEDEDESAPKQGILAAHEAKTPASKAKTRKSTPGLHSDSPQVPTPVLRSATKNFIPGLPVAAGDAAGLGLTQIFAGTMADDSQAEGAASIFGSPSQFMPTIGNFVQDSLVVSSGAAKNQDVIRSSQPTQDWVKQVQDSGDTGSQAVKLDFSQSQVHGLGTLLRDVDISQADVFMDSQDMPSQDYTPLKVRFIEHQSSTIATEVLDPTQTQTPTRSLPPQRRGKLHSRADLAKLDDGESDVEVRATPEDSSVFQKMKEAALAKKHAAAFDRKKSKAKEMVEEQAEESEDEYAGLGGADGEDSDDESLASVKDLIDDEQKVTEADNAKLAAFYADREREQDERHVEKLFRDVTTGMLHRKRGADYDLSDSDDDGEARRRMKRRQFAKMQKALFADERISKVAANPRNQAFLRTIEDIGSDDDMDFILDEPAAGPLTGSTESEKDSSEAFIPDTQPGPSTAAAAGTANAAERRANRRRKSASGKKPSNLGEIRETLSSLLDESSNLSRIADTEFGSDEEEDEERESRPVHMVNRIGLGRGNSSSSSTSGNAAGPRGAAGRSAFDTGLGPGVMGPTGFRVPALLRRATTNSLMSSASGRSSGSGSSTMNMTSAGDNDGKIRKNASKQSGINYFARENERRAALAEGEKRRLAKKVRSAEGRSKIVGGLFGAGKFE